MTQTDAFSLRLLAWYHLNKRPMPWRETQDPYRIWLSEVMLQQTQVATVIPYYNRFLTRYPTLNDLAHAKDEDVLKLWEGLGYYRRCHNFLKAVRTVSQYHQGHIPNDPNAFLNLPGVGEYTTAAVMSIAFGHPLPVVDGNVIRVMARYHCIAEDSTKTVTRNIIKGWMEHFIPKDRPGDFNQAVMELGATVCTPKQPDCHACPVQSTCCAFKGNTIQNYPLIPKKEKVPEYQVGLAVILRDDGSFLIQKRPSEGHLAGMWEFPGGKAVNGENAEGAVLRKCREELGITVKTVKRIARVSQVYSHFKIKVSVYVCGIAAGQPQPLVNQPLAWIRVEELENYPFPSANHKFFEALKKHCHF